MTLRAQSVTLRLGTAQVLKEVSLEVTVGAVTALVGPNGAGKSSLLRVLSGEIALPGVSMDGKPLAEMAIRDLARRRSVMTQSASMAFDFLVAEVLAMGWVDATREECAAALEERAAALEERTAALEERTAALEAVACDCLVDHLLDRRFNTLSGGERQRVQFARCWLQIWRREKSGSQAPSRYLLLDEPTANLDLAHELLVLRLARRASAANVGVLIVLHDLSQAARFADRIALLDNGAMVATGPPEAVLTNATLSRVYRTPLCVEHSPSLGRLVVHAQ